MRTDRRRVWLWVALAAGSVLLLVLLCGALALARRGRAVPPMAAPPPGTEQRVVQFAEGAFGGTVTHVTAHATTLGDAIPSQCSLLVRLHTYVELLRGQTDWNGCDNGAPMWEFTLQGAFRSPDWGTVDTLRIVTAPDGNVYMVDDRPAQQR